MCVCYRVCNKIDNNNRQVKINNYLSKLLKYPTLTVGQKLMYDKIVFFLKKFFNKFFPKTGSVDPPNIIGILRFMRWFRQIQYPIEIFYSSTISDSLFTSWECYKIVMIGGEAATKNELIKLFYKQHIKKKFLTKNDLTLFTLNFFTQTEGPYIHYN